MVRLPALLVHAPPRALLSLSNWYSALRAGVDRGKPGRGSACAWRALVLVLLLSAGMQGPLTPVHAGGGGVGAYDVRGIKLLVETGDPRIDLAERYALYVLGADFNGVAHVAAAGYYVNPWIRDSFAWGMIPSLTDSS